MMTTINATVTETTPPTIATVLPDGSFGVSTTTMKIFYVQYRPICCTQKQLTLQEAVLITLHSCFNHEALFRVFF